jgi:hypothetical protein
MRNEQTGSKIEQEEKQKKSRQKNKIKSNKDVVMRESW